MDKIKIAGAGLSGLAAAINLAKAGKDVEVFESGKDCGCRFHGDLQGIENWSYEDDAILHLKNIGIEINFKYKPVSSIILTSNKESIQLKQRRHLFIC